LKEKNKKYFLESGTQPLFFVFPDGGKQKFWAGNFNCFILISRKQKKMKKEEA
jgi:hypothetical protein